MAAEESHRARRGRPSRRTAYLLSGVILLASALGVDLVVQAVSAYEVNQPVAGGRAATGTVVSVADYCSRGCTYRPTIAFYAQGRTWTFNGSYHESKPRVGSTVPVSYTPADPGHAHELDKDPAVWIVDVALAALFLGIAAGLVLLFATAPRRLRRKAASTAEPASAAEPAWDPTWDDSLRDLPCDEDR